MVGTAHPTQGLAHSRILAVSKNDFNRGLKNRSFGKFRQIFSFEMMVSIEQ
jgi:hypothetical protein